MKKRLLSGIRVSGDLHIGNYFGALRQWVRMQKEYESFAMLADLHAITSPFDPKTLSRKTLDTVKIYLASGLDPKKTAIFAQSHVHEHTELAWILGTITKMGELSRMTQFKEKTAAFKGSDLKSEGGLAPGSVNLGLFAYPVLMASDILLYAADAVPVGEDQKQHVELTRDVAERFNKRFGKALKVTQIKIEKAAARIMSLDDPGKKMSKTGESAGGYVLILDSKDQISKKIKAAVTDSGNEIVFNEPEKPAISNLMNIYSLCAGLSIPGIEKEFKGRGYGEFKKALTENLISYFEPLQKRFRGISDSEAKKVLSDGAKRASAVASQTLKSVKEKIGLLIL